MLEMFNCNITPREGASQSATMNLRDSLSKPNRELWSLRPSEATTVPRPRVLLLLAGALVAAAALATVASRDDHATQHRRLKTEAQLREGLLKAFKCLGQDTAWTDGIIAYSTKALDRSDDTDFSNYFEELLQDGGQKALLSIINSTSLSSNTKDATTLLELFLQATDLLPGRLEQILASKDADGDYMFHNLNLICQPEQFSVILEALPQHQDIRDAIADVTMRIGCPAVIGNIIASYRPPNLRSELLNQISPCTGHTPLVEAVHESGLGEILPNVQLLVNAGADPNLSTRHGTALDIVNGGLQNFPDFLRATEQELIEELQTVKTYLESVME